MSTPISISRRGPSLEGAAFAPWLASSIYNKSAPSIARPTAEGPTAEEATASMHMSPPAFCFPAGSPNAVDVSGSLRAYDATRVELEHCTGYECCNLKLSDMHAVMEHFESEHRRSRLAHLPRPVLAPSQVFRSQAIIAPIVPLLPPFQPQVPASRKNSLADDYDMMSSSAPSPCPSTTTCSDRSRSSVSEDTEFPVDLDRLPQTPPAVLQTSSHVDNVRIAGEFTSPDGGFSNFHNYNPFAQPISATSQNIQKQPSLFPIVPVSAAPAQPHFQTQGNFPIYHQQYRDGSLEANRPVIHVQVPTPALNDLPSSSDYAPTPDTPSFGGGDSLHTPSTAAPSPISPFNAQLPQATWPQQPLQQQLLQPPHLSQNHPFHQPQPQAFARPQLDAGAFMRNHAPAQVQQQPEVYAVRSAAARSDFLASANVSFSKVVQPQVSQPITPPSLYTATTKRSHDQVEDGSGEQDYQGYDDEEDEDDADGEVEIIAHYPAPKAATSPTRQSSSAQQPKEKKAKTGRPKASGTRASAQKDPKRAKLFCPNLGCTKRYMNPNGLKYHLEKGTCTFE